MQLTHVWFYACLCLYVLQLCNWLLWWTETNHQLLETLRQTIKVTMSPSLNWFRVHTDKNQWHRLAYLPSHACLRRWWCHCVLSSLCEDPLWVYRERRSREQLKDYQREQHHLGFLEPGEKREREELVRVSNRRYYTLSNSSRNQPEAVIDVRHEPTYTTAPVKPEDASEKKNPFLSNQTDVSCKFCSALARAQCASVSLPCGVFLT